MDLITGKAKEAFEKWFDDYSQKHHCKEWLDNDLYLDEVYLPSDMLNALIIDWLDSVGIYVETFVLSQDREIGFCFNISGNEIFEDGMWHNDRHQATQEAIKKAVEIYNKGAK